MQLTSMRRERRAVGPSVTCHGGKVALIVKAEWMGVSSEEYGVRDAGEVSHGAAQPPARL